MAFKIQAVYGRVEESGRVVTVDNSYHRATTERGLWGILARIRNERVARYSYNPAVTRPTQWVKLESASGVDIYRFTYGTPIGDTMSVTIFWEETE